MQNRNKRQIDNNCSGSCPYSYDQGRRMRAKSVGRRNCRGVPIAHNSNEHNATNASFHWCVVLKWC